MQVPWPRRGMGRVASRRSRIPDSPRPSCTSGRTPAGPWRPGSLMVTRWSGGLAELARSTKKRRHPLLGSSSQRGWPSQRRRRAQSGGRRTGMLGIRPLSKPLPPSHSPSARLPPAQTPNASPWCWRGCRQTRDNLDRVSESCHMLRVRGEGVADCPRDGRG